MGQTLLGAALAKVDHPASQGPCSTRVDQQRACTMQGCYANRSSMASRDQGDGGRRQGWDGAIYLAQDEHVDVAHVSWHEVGHDLPPSMLQPLVAACIALKQQVHRLWIIALADDALTGR